MLLIQEAKDHKFVKQRLQTLIAAVERQEIITLIVEATSKCNLKCSFCVMHGGGVDTKSIKKEMMSEDVWQVLLKSVKSLAYKIQLVQFHGYGEPLLNKKIYRMIAEIRPFCNEIRIITNGVALNKKNHRKLLEAGVNQIHVSLDVGDQKAYKRIKKFDYFDRVLKNIKDGLDYYNNSVYEAEFFIKIAVTDKDLENFWGAASVSILDSELALHKLKPLFFDHPRVHLKLMPLFTTYNGHQKFENIKSGCEMPFYMVLVNARGHCAPCCVVIFDDLTLGSIKENRLNVHTKLRDLRLAHIEGKFTGKFLICSTCGARTAVDVRKIRDQLIALI